jgi:hypothetical protein
LITVGGFQAIAGVVAHATWGWAYAVLGGVAGLAGFGVLIGQGWARIAGIVLAGAGVVVNAVLLTPYPGWSTFAVGLDLVVIYALAIPGHDIEA